MEEQQLMEGVDYEIVEDPKAPGGQRVRFFEHVEVPTCQRIETTRDRKGKVLSVSLVPARGPAVEIHHNSSSVVASCAGPLYRRGSEGSRNGRRRPRRLPQI